MKDLVLHPATQEQLQALRRQPAHAIILAGPSGSGKFSLAVNLLETILGIDNLATYAYGKIITGQDKSIGIEAVRDLEQFLSLKVPGVAEHDRAVIIEHAQQLTLEAQNALLKTLEEPPLGTIIVLTVNHIQSLLPTIRSRSRIIHVHRPGKAALQEHFAAGAKPIIDKVYAISGGLPGLMSALLADEAHPLLAATETARAILSKNTYERLLMVDELSKQKSLAQDTAFILQQMAHAGLVTGKGTDKWQKVLTAAYEAGEQLAGNAQAKLILTKLMLSI